jgi:hypothetical protein
MKNIIALLLASICSLASAEWINVGASEDGSFDIFIDNSSIQKIGSISQVSWIKNYSSIQSTRRGKKYKSVHMVSVYDCKLELSKFASIAFYSESMAAGEAVISNVNKEDEPFSPILSSSDDAMVWQFVCKNTNIERGNKSQKNNLPTKAGGDKELVKLFVAGPDEGNEAGATIYLDQNSFAGNLVKKKFVLVIDYPEPLAVEKNMMKSTVMRMEMNCGESLIRAVKLELMSEQLGAGNLVKAVDGDSWRKVPSNFYMLPDLVCKK